MRQQNIASIRRVAHRPPLRRSLFMVALAVVTGLGGLLAAGQIARRTVAAGIPAPGRLIDVGGYRLHLHCIGQRSAGEPTLVLEAGLGESSLTWAGIQPTLAAAYRVCAYDRAGYGWSDPAPHRPSAAATVTDLRTLLHAANEPGPYVLVAHSLGGLYARLFAQRFPDDVAGLALLDPSHEEMISQLPPDWQASIRAAKVEGARQLRIPALLADLGLTALIPGLASADLRLPTETQATLRTLSGASGKSWRAVAQELGADEAILAEAQAVQITDLGDRPLVVVKAGAAAPGAPPAGLSPFTPTRDLHRELAAQSTRGRLVTLDRSTHYVHYDAPERVIALITTLMEEVKPLTASSPGDD
jgi:pimeloyl-ACP methyl ester carboxylesterase